MSQINLINSIDTDEATIELKSDGIVYVFLKDNCILDIDLQLKLLELYKKITTEKVLPFIFTGGENVTITKEARDNFKLIENHFPILASAVIANNLAYKLVANFYLQFYKPKMPYRVFNTEKEAKKWLSHFMK